MRPKHATMTKRWRQVRTAIAAIVAAALAATAGAGVYLTQRYVHPPRRQAFVGGRILTMDAKDSVAEALLLEGDRIAKVGSDAEIRASLDGSTTVTDLHGRTLMPGIVDAHSHFPGSGLSAVAVNLNSPPIGDVKSLDEAFARLRERAAATPPGQRIMAFGFDNTLIAEKRFPTRTELDAISTAHPIYVNHISGHLGVANSRMLADAGIGADTPDPKGGKIDRDPSTHEPTGLVTEAVALRMMAIATNFRLPDVWRMLETANLQYLSMGITTAQMGLLEENYRRSLVPMASWNLLPMRLVVFPSPEVSDAILDGRVDATDTPRLHWGAFKMVLDGSIQGYTAFLSAPYFRRPEDQAERGYLSMDEAEFRARVMRYQAAGRQMAVHVCGDAAMDVFLDAFEAAQKAHPSADPRAIAMHSLVARPEQLERAARLGVTPSFTSTHVYYWGDRHRETFLGPERAAAVAPAGTAQKMGLRFAINMDTPVVPMNPWLLAWIVANRKTAAGLDLGPEERIDARRALRALTIDAAWQSFVDVDRGSIEPGKYADLIVLSDDPLRDPDSLREIRVLQTVVGGVTVYSRDDSQGARDAQGRGATPR